MSSGKEEVGDSMFHRLKDVFLWINTLVLENISGYERNVINEKLKRRKSLYFRRVFRNNISSLVVHKSGSIRVSRDFNRDFFHRIIFLPLEFGVLQFKSYRGPNKYIKAGHQLSILRP